MVGLLVGEYLGFIAIAAFDLSCILSLELLFICGLLYFWLLGWFVGCIVYVCFCLFIAGFDFVLVSYLRLFGVF